MSQFCVLLKNGYVVDPATNKEGYFDIGISNGKIMAVEKELSANSARQVINLEGNVCIPGIIDSHVHVTGRSRQYGYRMLARAGVTTALDCAGPVDEVINHLPDWGAGINIAVLNGVVPNETVSSICPNKSEIIDFIDKSAKKGAIGVKLIGGHYPITPDATRAIIQEANNRKVYVAFHAGTTNKGSNIEGMEEALELAAGLSMQLCHINAYCRGLNLGSSLVEAQKGMELLRRVKRKGIVTESHVGPYNGTSAKCVECKPMSHVTRTCLRVGGYPDTEDGLKTAISEGYAVVNKLIGDEISYANPEEGLNYWLENKTEVTVSFPVNKRDTAFVCATSKDSNGDFDVDALSTDGGGIPRNFLISKGLLLVKFNALTLEEFVFKTSTIPAKMLGLVNKGHFRSGADADITVFNWSKEEPVLTMVAGNVVMYKKLVYGEGGTIITTEAGINSMTEQEVPYQVAEMDQSLLYS